MLWLIFKKAKPLYAITLFVIVISLPLIAYFALPTFENRVKYFLHDYTYFKDAPVNTGSITQEIMTLLNFKTKLSQLGHYITSFSKQWTINPLLFGWIITALLRVTIGSATVAGLTAAGIVAPLVANGQVSRELMVLSVGAGSIFGSHINDTGFWMFKEFLGLSLRQTFLSWTVMETTMSILGLIGVLALQLTL